VRIDHLRRLIDLVGERDYIYKLMAEAYYEHGDDEQARTCLLHAYKLNPQLRGAVKISKALGFSKTPEPKRFISRSAASAQYKYARPAQIPSYAQINKWKQNGEWSSILEYANPHDYFPGMLCQARPSLCQIADSLGSYENSKSIDALITLLHCYYWDVSFAAMTSLSKIGDEKVLAILENFEARTMGRRARLDESISYLKKRISHQKSLGNTISLQELLAQSKKAFFEDKNYQDAQILLESILPQIERSDPKYLDVVILLARSCAETKDYGKALEIIKPIIPTLPRKHQDPLAQEMASWFWLDLGCREYTSDNDNDYWFALQADIESVLTEDNVGEALYKLKSMTRHLEHLGARSSINLIRKLIRTEAPGSQYVDANRENYIWKTDLRPVMKDFFAKFDETIKTRVTAKIKNLKKAVPLFEDDQYDEEEIDDDDFLSDDN
jgi:tetratricopeptide (TPR) repeat protein